MVQGGSFVSDTKYETGTRGAKFVVCWFGFQQYDHSLFWMWILGRIVGLGFAVLLTLPIPVSNGHPRNSGAIGFWT